MNPVCSDAEFPGRWIGAAFIYIYIYHENSVSSNNKYERKRTFTLTESKGIPLLFFFVLHSLDLRKKLKALTKLKLLRRIRYRFLYQLLETGISTNPLNPREKIKGAREDKDRSCQTRYCVCRRAARSLTLIFFSLSCLLDCWTE